jgi:CHAT domain-containing protein
VAQGKYAEAWAAFQEAKATYSITRSKVAFEGADRSAWLAERSGYETAACIAARLGRHVEAWQVVEEGMGRGLWDDISRRATALLAPSEQQALKEAERELKRLQHMLETKDSVDARGQAQRDLSAAALRLSRLRLAHAKKHGPMEGVSLSLEAIQTALPADTALVTWLDTKRMSAAVDPDGEHWAVVVRSDGAPTWIECRGSGAEGRWTEEDMALPIRIREQLREPRSDQWRGLVERLRRQRIEPIRLVLAARNGLPAVRQLVVLPTKALAGFPVELLRPDDERWNVTYAPSGTVYTWLGNERERRAKTRGNALIALGDPVFREPSTSPDAGSAPVPPHGILVQFVQRDSNAANAGIRAGDVLLSYNGKPIKGPSDISGAPAASASETIAVEIWRDGKTARRSIRSGKLGITVAKEAVPQAVREKRRFDAAVATARTDGEHFVSLPGTAWEVENVAKRAKQAALSIRSLVGLEACEPEIHKMTQSGELARYRFVHFATHAVINEQFPARSAIIVTQADSPDVLEALREERLLFDGRVSVDEMRLQWRLNSDLVTLSGCETALGKQEGGEGLVGFTQALLLCGADAVCLSLWKVDDTATALLMDRFYANLWGQSDGPNAKPLSKTEALAEARIWLRQLTAEDAVKRVAILSQGVSRGAGHKAAVLPSPKIGREVAGRPYEHPYYWAAFVLVGRTD